ncbi:LLM class flavin-dependent oxidoreductase [Lentzea sp. BCCO 10_0798]|uniref:LLM class flavin-dependent oxidoreductase n=1 Tax=Lentzea kristufekii TaxID=3095430 RepID=A0ABU4TNS6_9PSEU|nr:LLM class flavin-dependent oxidoreductase [Lentzea sp. BCCO 10_0798]MDX8049931.1 LLM class flavin-dependent oxidoreductase [Lentzea sp. BCCO 10_0798]
MKFSVHVPFMPVRPDQIGPVAALVQRANTRLWLGQALAIEPHQVFAYAAGLGHRIPVGTSVTLMPLRHPYEAALQARSLAMLTGQPAVAGYGPGPVDFQRATGGRYRSPLTATREYLTTVRGLLDGETIHLNGEYFRLEGTLPPFPHEHVEVGVGVLRPAMARLAGEVADVAITWLCPPAYIRDVLKPELGGRTRVVSVVHVAQRKPGRDLDRVAFSVCGRHLQAPHYVSMLNQAGVAVDPTDPESGARRLVEEGLFLTGTLPEIVAGLREYHAAGVDEVVLNLSGVGAVHGDAVAVRELEFLLGELGLVTHERAARAAVSAARTPVIR